MIKKRIFLIIYFLFLLSFYVYSFNPLDLLYSSHIDTSLNLLNMNRKDLYLNIDFKKDIFRLKIIDSLFINPIKSFNYTSEIADFHFNNFENIDKIIKYDFFLLNCDTLFNTIKYNYNTESKALDFIKNCLNFYLPDIYANIDSAFIKLTKIEFDSLKDYATSYTLPDINYDNMSLKEIYQSNLKADNDLKNYGSLASKFQINYIFKASIIANELLNILENYFKSNIVIFENMDYNTLLETKYGNIIINPKNPFDINNTLMVIDFKSDSYYYFNSNFEKFQIILDFKGNDKYFGKNINCGAGFFGINILKDFDGNDLYYSENISLGTGLFGCGILIDNTGDDRYISKKFSQGSGEFGIGLLIDSNGNDTYESEMYSQGFGSTMGLGGLFDLSGNDEYIIKKTNKDILRYDEHYESLGQGCGLGKRPYFSGGIGIIADKSGNDNYITDIFGQGVGYWFSLGSLFDYEGNDRYISYQYSQGSGVHLAFGVLIDFFGKDNYITHGVSQGCGHDLAFGGIFDFYGNDNYICDDLSQGGGNANAISFFLDATGNDGYIAKDYNTMGYSDYRRNYGYIGIFNDLNGFDYYGSPWGKNNSFWLHSTYGVGRDAENSYIDTLIFIQKYDAAPASDSLGNDIETLFLQASAALEKYRLLVPKAIKKIIEMGEQSLPYLITKFDSNFPREVNALIEIIPKIGDKAFPYLEKIIENSDSLKYPLAIYFIGKIKNEKSFDLLAKLYKEKPKYKLNIIKALAELNDKKVIPYLKENLADSSISIRRESLIGLSKVNDESVVDLIILSLNDDYQEVRYSAQNALSNIKPFPYEKIFEYYPQLSDLAKMHAIKAIENNKDKNNKKYLKSFFKKYGK